MRSSFSAMVQSCGLAGLLMLTLCGCEGAQFGAREKGALGGAAMGAGLGAIVGNQVGSTGAGIAIGSAFGAISGALVGNEIDNENAALDERDERLKAQERELEENRRLLEQLRGKGIDARTSGRGVIANLPDVLFEFDSARLTPEAREVAAQVADVIKDAPGRRVAVEGHTDSVGTIAYNQKLSEQRARAAADELIRNGVSRSVIRSRGMGESDPVASNSTEEGRERNRRVEIIIENR